ncbi:Membrane protein related to metalloendopeptidase [Geitlerinema sp. FC II]|nr:DUF928 domain-containing protein [Geitlerinema sp. CS-897]PPT05933.1 Membrane protein related to metalloendopeptidase [Geitlerinema sp. FC II]
MKYPQLKSLFGRTLAATAVGAATLFAVHPASAVTFGTPDGVAGTPSTASSGGASRTAGLCLAGSANASALQPLLPGFQRVLTVSERPEFFVSVPSMTATTASFSLQDEEREYYRTQVELPAEGGIVSVTLPEGVSLEAEKDYKWYFEIHCVSEVADPDNPNIEGTVYRMPLEDDLAADLEAAATAIEAARAYSEAGIWYDALSTLARARQDRPQDASVASNWNEFLASVGLDNLARQPLAD